MGAMAQHFGEPMVLRPAESGSALRVNRRFTERLGFTSEELESRPLLDWIHPEDREAVEQALAAGKGGAMARHRTRLDSWFPFRWQVKTDMGQTVALGIFDDRFEVAEDESGSGGVSAPVTLEDTLNAMARIIEAKNPGMRCSILLVGADGMHITGGAGPSLPDAFNKAVEGMRIGPMVGSCGTAAYWNMPVVVENIVEDPLGKDLREAAALAGVNACWSQPIVTSQGVVLGAMALYNDRPRAPTQSQMDGLEIAARMAGLAIERNRIEEQALKDCPRGSPRAHSH